MGTSLCLISLRSRRPKLRLRRLQQRFLPSDLQRRLPRRHSPRQREARKAVCFIRPCLTFRGTHKTRSRDVSKSWSTFRWTPPATSQRQNSFLGGRALTLRIGRWQQRELGNSTRRRSTDKPSQVSGTCVFSFEEHPSTCFPWKNIPKRNGSTLRIFLFCLFPFCLFTINVLHLPNHLPQHAEQEFCVAGLQMKPPHQSADRTVK